MLALLLVVGLSSPATLASGAGAERPTAPILEDAPEPVRLAQHVDPTAPDYTPTFIEQFLSLTISPYATREVQNGLVLSHVIGYIAYPLCGGLWGPLIAVRGAQATGDVVVSWFVSSIMWGVITVAATFTVVGAFLWLAVPYFGTTATLNAIDRDIKKRGAATPAPGTPAGPPQPAAPPPPPPGDTPPPSYAY